MSMDARSGFCSHTATFRSLRPPLPLPDDTVSFTSFAFSRLPSPLPPYPAFLDASTGAALSFPALLSRVRSLAGALRGLLGVRKGDVALVLSPPSLDVPVLFLAVMSVGAVVSPVNPASTAADIRRAFSLCNPSFAFATAKTAGKLPPPGGNGRAAVVLLDSPEIQSFLHGQDQTPQEDAEVRQSDVAAINYSSGTTGRTKAVALPHRRLIVSALQFRSARPRTPGGDAVTLLGVPMFHSYGFLMLMRGIVMAETTVVVTTPRGGAAGVAEVAARCRATQMFVAPPVVVAMVRGAFRSEGFPDLVRVVCGGAPLSALSAEAFQDHYPHVELSTTYGSTEGGMISTMIGQEKHRPMKSTGRLCSNVEVKVVDIISGKPLSTNEQGELYVRSPGMMLGYVGDNEANILAFGATGWLKTGDLGCFDEDGFLYIIDRIKELIKYKGYQIIPAELEDMLQMVPGLFDAAVMPYPDEEVGQLPMALVVKQKGTDLTEDQVMNYVNKQVAPYKKIRKVVFVDSVPRLPSGKIWRRELHKLAMVPKKASRL